MTKEEAEIDNIVISYIEYYDNDFNKIKMIHSIFDPKSNEKSFRIVDSKFIYNDFEDEEEYGLFVFGRNKYERKELSYVLNILPQYKYLRKKIYNLW